MSSNYAFNFTFNITGNCNAAVQEIAENVDRLNHKIKDSAISGAAGTMTN